MSNRTEFEDPISTALTPYEDKTKKRESIKADKKSIGEKASGLLGEVKKQVQDMGKDVDQKTLELHFEQFNRDKKEFWEKAERLEARTQNVLDMASRVSENLSRTQAAVVEKQSETTTALYETVNKLVKQQTDQDVFRMTKDISLIALAGGGLVLGGFILRSLIRQERKSDLIIQQQAAIYQQALEASRSGTGPSHPLTRFSTRQEQASPPALH